MCVACHLTSVEATLVAREARARAHGDGDWRCIRDQICVDCGLPLLELEHDRVLKPCAVIGRTEPAIDHMCMAVLDQQIVGPSQHHGAKKYLEVHG